MCRASFFAWTQLLMTVAAFGQPAPSESQTTQTVLGEIRQLRQDLQNVAATIQRVQIVMYRLQAENTLLNRATERLENARVTCTQAQGQRKYMAAQLEQAEARQRNSQSPSDQRAAEGMVGQLKSSAEMLASAEQECQTNEVDAESKLRTEQNKMDDLQDQLDKLDKVLASYRGK
jgi:chromosome segregation ATPase